MTFSVLAPASEKEGEIMTAKQLIEKNIQEYPDVAKAAEALVGLSYYEWQRLKIGIDEAFKCKQGEFNRTLKLSSSEEVMRLIP